MEVSLLGIPLWQFLAVACVSFAASIVGGLAGYGTGLLLPLVLVPTVGPEPVVPIIGITALFTNGGRVAAFWRHIDAARALRVFVVALPCTVASATFYTWLSGRGVSLLLGLTLLLLVPLRRLLARLRFVLGKGGLLPAAAVYGTLAGGTTGSGVVLISILMASGLQGSAVIATDDRHRRRQDADLRRRRGARPASLGLRRADRARDLSGRLRRAPSFAGRPTRPERPSGVGGAGVEHGGRQTRHCRGASHMPGRLSSTLRPHPYPSPQGGGESASASPEPRPIQSERIPR
jgi:hypothetical protein